jgi:uncharacterized membrane protein YedE/YeeE
MNSIIGGMIIGVAVSIMLLFNGRVTGISGIVGGLLNKETLDKNWRVLFTLGLLIGGIILRIIYPESFTLISNATTFDYIFAGFLVGFGTLLGNGCTSGHGVCGISRLSARSIGATVTFIVFGFAGVLLFKALRGEL